MTDGDEFGPEIRFVGQPAQHGFGLHHRISHLLMKHGDKIEGIVELGTAAGALSIYLGLWAARLGVSMSTFDNASFPLEPRFPGDHPNGAKTVFDKLNIEFLRVNIFSEDGRREVLSRITGKPVYLFCDNGNKPREFNMFVPHLVSGSIVSVHDWPGEIGPADVEDLVKRRGLKPWADDIWTQQITASWIVP